MTKTSACLTASSSQSDRKRTRDEYGSSGGEEEGNKKPRDDYEFIHDDVAEPKYACHFHQNDPLRFSCHSSTGTKY